MPRIRIYKDEDRNWANNAIQFPRFIEEAQMAGAFTNEVLRTMSESMELDFAELEELMNRAREQWDDIKARTKPGKK